MKSTEILRKAAQIQEERGKQYDSPEGERSMASAIAVFNQITHRTLEEHEGWLLLQILKDVRLYSNLDGFHEDSAIDGVSYSSLKTEAWYRKYKH